VTTQIIANKLSLAILVFANKVNPSPVVFLIGSCFKVFLIPLIASLKPNSN
jgi:hypothetical protein